MANHKQVNASLLKAAKEGSTVVKDAASLVTFATSIATAQAATGVLLFAAIVSAIGAAVSATSRVIEAIAPDSKQPEIEFKSNAEKFDALFFTVCQRCYLEALSESKVLKLLQQHSESGLTPQQVEQLSKTLQDGVAQLTDAEVRYHFSVDPSKGSIPLFDALNSWLSLAIRRQIRPTEHNWEGLLTEIAGSAQTKLHIVLASGTPPYDWMFNYLALQIPSQILSNMHVQQRSTDSQLRSISQTLEGWTEVLSDRDRAIERWSDYRDLLRELPRHKESMYDEDFGVDKVFVPPVARYHRSIAGGISDNPDVIEDVGRLIGALVSSRTTGEDLIFICGGPGSGKSTLCRVIAAELAERKDIFPVFLRLRRFKDRDEPATFIEENMVALGLINRLSDTKDISNLVLILDGFDELVLASKSRLSTFFKNLLEDLRTGPLRSTRIIVSGRDTLFPKGSGLPRGSHIINILPFDQERVKCWGEKWRIQHHAATGRPFQPESLVSNPKHRQFRELVKWPLTLHLLARLHTANLFDFGATDESVEKAYLYRGILHETANRQHEQVSGDGNEGRLDPRKMREFLREIAWIMYVQGVDSLDVSEVIPIAGNFFPARDEVAMTGLAEIAVVNCPEITKGEETGFEFVHKSFSEYLVAERLSKEIDSAAETIVERDGSTGWRYKFDYASATMWRCFSSRLLTAEVQEMLEPMLGVFHEFSRSSRVNDKVTTDDASAGLRRVIARCTELYAGYLNTGMPASANAVTPSPLVKGRKPSAREAEANYGAGVVLVAAAGCRRLSVLTSPISFDLEPFEGAFWRWVLSLHAGGVTIEHELALRLYSGCSVQGSSPVALTGEFSSPIRLGHLSLIQNLQSPLRHALYRLEHSIFDMIDRASVLAVLQSDSQRNYGAPGWIEQPPENVREQSGSAESTSMSRSARRRLRGDAAARGPRGERDDVTHFLSHLIDNVQDSFRVLYGALESGGVLPPDARLSERSRGSHSSRRREPDRIETYIRIAADDRHSEIRDVDGSLYSSLVRSLCGRESPPWEPISPPFAGELPPPEARNSNAERGRRVRRSGYYEQSPPQSPPSNGRDIGQPSTEPASKAKTWRGRGKPSES